MTNSSVTSRKINLFPFTVPPFYNMLNNYLGWML